MDSRVAFALVAPPSTALATRRPNSRQMSACGQVDACGSASRLHVPSESVPSSQHRLRRAPKLTFEFYGRPVSWRSTSAPPRRAPTLPRIECAGKTDFKDFYTILGVSKNATAKEIKTAFRELARKTHPDVCREPGAEAKFKEINEAYEVLSDPDKRRRYDQFGQYWKQAGGPGMGGPDMGDFGRYTSFDDFLADLLGKFGANGGGNFRVNMGGRSPFGGTPFGNMGGFPFGGMGGMGGPGVGARPGAAPGQAQQAAAKISLSLGEAYRGTTRALRVQRPGGEEQVTVRIPPGAYPDAKIRVAGRGPPDPMTGRAGDLMLACDVAEHPVFKLAAAPGGGFRLEVDVPIAPDEAALGASVDVPTPGGAVKMQLPAGVRSGQLLRLKGKGWPDIKGGGVGDLYARMLVVAAPPAGGLSDPERAAYEQLRAARTWNPRASLGSATL